MARTTANQHRKIIDKALILLGVISTIVLLAIGGVAWWAYSFTTTTVKNQLAEQKIYFPPAGSEALNAAEFPGLQKYAGQQVDDGPKAKAYADEFIAVHLQKIADGQTYSEVSTKALANPTDQKLQAQANTLFKGETLRGLLLGDAYAFWTIGMIAKTAALIAFAGGAVMALLVLLGLRHLASIA